jgi:hypothetical protein
MGATRLGGFTTALTDIDTSQQEYLGAIREDNNAEYKYVKFSGSNATAVGDFVCYVVSDTALQTVNPTNSIIGAGVAMAVHPSGSVTYGWIQIKGVATLSTALTSGVAGNALTAIGGGDKTLAVSAAATSVIVAQCIVAATPLVLLKCEN